MRAALLASATAATLVGLRASRERTHSPFSGSDPPGGSYNWTHGAAENSEDLNLISSPTVAATYAAHWRQRLAVSAPFVDREDWCRSSSAEVR
jgi:hypothetical protein